MRCMDVFRQLDDDDSGVIDRYEFRKAMREMGADVPDAVLDELFNTFDLNHNWTIEYEEIATVLSVSKTRRNRAAGLTGFGLATR